MKNLFFLLLFSSCSSLHLSDEYKNVNLDYSKKVEVRFFKQDTNQCGPTSLFTILDYLGSKTDYNTVRNYTFTPKSNGSHKVDMLSAARRLGFTPYKVTIEQAIHELKNNQLSLIFQNLGFSWYPKWHYSVLVGVNHLNRKVLLHDGANAYSQMRLKRFFRTWERGEKWSYLITREDYLPKHVNYNEALNNAILLNELKYPQKSLTLLEKIETKFGEKLEVTMRQAYIYYDLKKYNLAYKFMKKAHEMHPGNYKLYKNLSEIERKRGNMIQAKRFLQKYESSKTKYLTKN